MNRRSLIQKLIAAGAGSFTGHLLLADPQGGDPQQTDPSQTEPRDDKHGDTAGIYTLRSEVRLVLLDVSVKDSKGVSVSGLEKEHFSVLENGQPQRITVFAHDDMPVTVGILVDQSRSMTPKRAAVVVAGEVFIQESNPLDEIFILHFNDTVTRGLPPDVLFSDDSQLLQTALHQGAPAGKTALNDAVVAGLEQLELGRRDKKTLVVISDGGDNASAHSRQEMLAMVEKSAATIYTIGLFDSDDTDRDPSILRQLSKISGGECYLPPSVSEMIPVCRRIARDIRARYTLGYVPAAGNGSLRHILRHVQVRASAPDHGSLSIRTRTSYRYDDVDGQKTK